MTEQPDYTAMEGGKLIAALGDDATKWAAAFCQHAERIGHVIDEGWMIGWFANAIECSHDLRTRSGSTVLPDGSAFFVADVGE